MWGDEKVGTFVYLALSVTVSSSAAAGVGTNTGGVDRTSSSDSRGGGNGARTPAELADVLHDALGHAVALVPAGALRPPSSISSVNSSHSSSTVRSVTPRSPSSDMVFVVVRRRIPWTTRRKSRVTKPVKWAVRSAAAGGVKTNHIPYIREGRSSFP